MFQLPAETQVVEPKPIVDEETEVVLKARDLAGYDGRIFRGIYPGEIDIYGNITRKHPDSPTPLLYPTIGLTLHAIRKIMFHPR